MCFFFTSLLVDIHKLPSGALPLISNCSCSMPVPLFCIFFSLNIIHHLQPIHPLHFSPFNVSSRTAGHTSYPFTICPIQFTFLFQFVSKSVLFHYYFEGCLIVHTVNTFLYYFLYSSYPYFKILNPVFTSPSHSSHVFIRKNRTVFLSTDKIANTSVADRHIVLLCTIYLKFLLKISSLNQINMFCTFSLTYIYNF